MDCIWHFVCHSPLFSECVCVFVTQIDCSLSGSRLSGSDAKAASLSTTMWSSAACSDWSIQSRLPDMWQAFRVTSTKWLTDSSNAVALKGYAETFWEQEAQWKPTVFQPAYRCEHWEYSSRCSTSSPVTHLLLLWMVPQRYPKDLHFPKLFSSLPTPKGK